MGALRTSRVTAFFLFVAIVFLGSLSLSKATFWMQSTQVNRWGKWGRWCTCPENSTAIGFRAKLAPPKVGDNTALNGVSLRCNTTSQYNRWIQSKEGDLGSWGETVNCPEESYLNGFKLRSLAPCLDGKCDNVAATDILFSCRSVKTGGNVVTLNAHGQDLGEWSGEQECPKGHGICGLQTQVQDYKYPEDQTGLNNVNFKCCWDMQSMT